MEEKDTERADLSRRDFIKVGATATAVGAVALALKQGLAFTGLGGEKAKAAQFEEKIVPTTCALCPSGCGLNVRVVNGKAVKVEGNPLHPLNQGVCCLKAQASLEILYSPERLQHPRIQMGKRGSGNWKEAPWDEALALVTQKLSDLRASGNPHKLALLYGEGRGQMRSLVGRFMQAFGSPNTIERQSLAEAAARQASFLTQGINGLPVYDLNNANYVMTFGGNLLEANRNVMVYLGAAAFMRRGRPQRGKLVSVHPRMSLTGVKADEWVPIRPGTYGALALGMANVIINSQLYDQSFVRDYTFGFEDFEDGAGNAHKGFKSLALEYTLDRVASITGVPGEIIARLAGEFATNRPAVAIMPNEVDELCSGNSLYTAMAIHALNALVGSIDQAGGVLVQRFPSLADWPSLRLDTMASQGLAQPRIDGAGSPELPLALSVYQNIPEAIQSGQPYPLEALFLLNANPVYDLPNNGRTVDAILSTPFVVSFAPTLDESAALADVILPASTFLEIWGDDYMEGVGYAGISLRQPVVDPVTDSRDPGDVLLELAARLGGSVAEALPWKDYRSLVDYRLSGLRADPQVLETNRFWAEMVYFNAQPGSPAWKDVVGRDRLNAPKDGRFDLFSRELFSLLTGGDDLAYLPHFNLPLTLGEGKLDTEYPYLLVMQPLITQAQTWQGIIPTLQECLGLQLHARWVSWVEINPLAAEELGLKEGEPVWVESRFGRVQAQVHVYPGIWPNAVFMPSGQGHHTLVSWGRGAPDAMILGANPNQLAMVGTETLNGQAVKGPLPVKIYRA